MSKVAIVRCESYKQEDVDKAIARAIDLLGGIKNFVSKNDKILLKPNLLAARDKDKAVTTHPAVFEATIKLFEGYDLSYGDSPGFNSPEKAAKECGLKEIADKYKVRFGEFDKGKQVHFKEGNICKQFDIANAVTESTAIISISKMKSHMLTRITGAIKNQLGCVYGLNKGAFHAKFSDAISFSKMLIDLNLLLKPKLFIMDGIVAMEGNGPASGNPIKMNVIIASNDPVAIDATFCKLVNLNPNFIPTIIYGKEYGLGDYENIEYVGDPIEDFINNKFDISRTPVKSESLNGAKFLRSALLRKPVINEKLCIKCGICVKSCPINALSQENKSIPKYEYSKCIRCYCCQEMCPQKAIHVKTPLLGKLVLYK